MFYVTKLQMALRCSCGGFISGGFFTEEAQWSPVSCHNPFLYVVRTPRQVGRSARQFSVHTYALMHTYIPLVAEAVSVPPCIVSH